MAGPASSQREQLYGEHVRLTSLHEPLGPQTYDDGDYEEYAEDELKKILKSSGKKGKGGARAGATGRGRGRGRGGAGAPSGPVTEGVAGDQPPVRPEQSHRVAVLGAIPCARACSKLPCALRVCAILFRFVFVQSFTFPFLRLKQETLEPRNGSGVFGQSFTCPISYCPALTRRAEPRVMT